ncbi:MAG: hypothetical protein Q9221_004041 [Calogaya cf. arnoldii]
MSNIVTPRIDGASKPKRDITLPAWVYRRSEFSGKLMQEPMPGHSRWEVIVRNGDIAMGKPPKSQRNIIPLEPWNPSPLPNGGLYRPPPAPKAAIIKKRARRVFYKGCSLGQSSNTRVVETPMMIAARDRRWNIVKLLLASGADPNIAASKPWTVLRYAAAGNAPLEIIELMTDATTDIKLVVNPPVPSIMEEPVTHKSAATVRFLLSKGANVKRHTPQSTQLSTAVYHGHLPVIEALLAAGADINARNTNPGDTALIVAT